MERFEREEGVVHVEARGSQMWFKATAADRAVLAHGADAAARRADAAVAPPRRQRRGVLRVEGVVEFRIARRWRAAARTPVSSCPPARRTPSGTPRRRRARLLVLHAPALDGYFVELAALWSGTSPPARADELALMQRHGMVPE